jgi:hypothetical protein
MVKCQRFRPTQAPLSDRKAVLSQKENEGLWLWCFFHLGCVCILYTLT